MYVPRATPGNHFPVQFYLVAMVFILFDIEAIFLYPWALVYHELRWFGFMEMILYVGILLAGYLYLWKKGALTGIVSYALKVKDIAAGESPENHAIVLRLREWDAACDCRGAGISGRTDADHSPEHLLRVAEFLCARMPDLPI